MSQVTRGLRRGFFLLLFSFPLFLPLLAPTPAEAAIIPCGRKIDDTATSAINEMAPCTLCHIIVGLKAIIDWGRNVMVAIAIAVMVAMGILYIVSTGDESLMNTAKSGIRASLIGFAVILLAWLVVNFVLTLPIFSTAGLVKTSGWFNFTCDLASSAKTSTGLAVNPGFASTTAPSPTTPTTPPVTGNTNPSTGISLTLTNGSLLVGQNTTLTINGSMNWSLGSVTFDTGASLVRVLSTAASTTTVEVPSGTAPGTYTITAIQASKTLATVTLTVLPNPVLAVDDKTPVPSGPSPGGSLLNAPNAIFFTSQNFSVMENAGSVSLSLSRPGGATLGAAVVSLKFSDATAVAGRSYTVSPSNVTVNFAPGATTATTTGIPILDNAYTNSTPSGVYVNNPSVFKAAITNVSGDGKAGFPGTTQISIFDDERGASPPSAIEITLSDPELGESLNSGSTTTFSVKADSNITLILLMMTKLNDKSESGNYAICNDADPGARCTGIGTAYSGTHRIPASKMAGTAKIPLSAGNYELTVRVCSEKQCIDKSVLVSYAGGG